MKKYKNFEFLKVNGAGHYVPMDLPRQSLEILQEYLLYLPDKNISEIVNESDWIRTHGSSLSDKNQ